MPAMTKEERIFCALNRQEPDRVPLYDLVSSIPMIEHFSGEKLTLENAAKVIPLAMSRSLDTTRVFLPGPLGRRTEPSGFTYERRDLFNEWTIGFPYHDLTTLDYFVRNEIERLEAWQPGNPEIELGQLRVWKSRYDGTVIPASWAGEALQDCYIQVGLDWFVWLDAEHPDLTQRWIQARHKQLLRRLQAESNFKEISPLAWIFGDVAYKQRLIFSPGFLHRHGFFQHIHEICDIYHAMHLKVIFHSDGDIQPIIDDLIAAGVDALAPIDVLAGMDLGSLKARYGEKVALVGGIDVENILRRGTEDEIRQAVLSALQAAGNGGGLILGSSSEELFENIPLNNILAYIETAWECGVYPIGSHFPGKRRIFG